MFIDEMMLCSNTSWNVGENHHHWKCRENVQCDRLEAGLVDRSKASHSLSVHGPSELYLHLPDTFTGVTFITDDS